MTRTLICSFLAATVLSCLPPQSAKAQVALYDNLALDPFFQFDNIIIGPRFDVNTEVLAQQFKTEDSGELLSVTLQLQRVGTPSGVVSVEIWDDTGADTPSSHITTIGSFEVSALSESPQFVSFDNLDTNLASQTPYYVVLNNLGTDIVSPESSYRFGLLGRVDDEQDEGTSGAARVIGSVPTEFGGAWTPLTDSLGCHPSGACSHYLRMSVNSRVPEPSTWLVMMIGAGLLAASRRWGMWTDSN